MATKKTTGSRKRREKKNIERGAAYPINLQQHNRNYYRYER